MSDEVKVKATAIDQTSTAVAPRRSAGWVLPLISLVVVVLDQLSKVWIRNTLMPGEERELWPGVLHLSHVLNHGAAWGILKGQKWLLILVTLFVMSVGISVARRVAHDEKWKIVGLGLILGGALGNLIDRIRFGFVTDMIDMVTSLDIIRTFPVFNVADCGLTVGMACLFFDLFFLENRRIQAAEKALSRMERTDSKP